MPSPRDTHSRFITKSASHDNTCINLLRLKGGGPAKNSKRPLGPTPTKTDIVADPGKSVAQKPKEEIKKSILEKGHEYEGE